MSTISSRSSHAAGRGPFADGTLTLQFIGGNTLVKFDADGSGSNTSAPVTS
jgi:hypothetical protein